MPKFFFKRILPTKEGLGRYKMLKPVLKRIGHVAIWQVNRHAIAVAAALGVFFGAQPVPIQMVMAAIAAGVLRVNLPCAVLFTLWSNPITGAPIYYFNYRVGTWLLQSQLQRVEPDAMQLDTIKTFSGNVLVPLFSGSLLVGVITATLVYVVIIYWWRISLMLHKSDRRNRYK